MRVSASRRVAPQDLTEAGHRFAVEEVRKSGIGGADGKHGLYEYTHSHVVYLEA